MEALLATWGAVHMMCKEGSGFESRLGDLWMHSDLGNRAKLEQAFSSTFSKFEDRYERHLEIKVEAEANQKQTRDIALERRALALSLRGRR